MPVHRGFLQSARTCLLRQDSIGGFYLSEKLRGRKIFWDGGVSRNLKTELVPWSSKVEPTSGNMRRDLVDYATGLWDKYGNPVIVEDSILDRMPPFLCEGHLTEDNEVAVYSTPPFDRVFQTGLIQDDYMLQNVRLDQIRMFYKRKEPDFYEVPFECVFEQELFSLAAYTDWHCDIYLHRHIRLPAEEERAITMVLDRLDMIHEQGGEGVILKDPNQHWAPYPVLLELRVQ